MWLSETFDTLDLLIQFLNKQRIAPALCKVVAVSEPRGAARFHLLYQLDDEPDPALLAVAGAEAELPETADREQAIDAAEAIIQDAQREE